MDRGGVKEEEREERRRRGAYHSELPTISAPLFAARTFTNFLSGKPCLTLTNHPFLWQPAGAS